MAACTSLFLPGWAARAGLYARGLPRGWETAEEPSFRVAPTFEHFAAWARRQVDQRPGRIALAGHSMGAALALLAAADEPAAVRSLLLFSPAGLPMPDSKARSAATFAQAMVAGHFPLREGLRSAGGVLRSPRAALRVANDVRDLDLTTTMLRVRAAGVPVTIVSCLTDTLVTPDSARQIADLTGGALIELPLAGGHLWMFSRWEHFRAQLATATAT